MDSTEQLATITVGGYLWHRIRQLGVQSMMGVPGDMNMELLDYIDRVEGLSWIVGNANELNAAYAADGYCRMKRAPGVRACHLPCWTWWLPDSEKPLVITTMGVGKLSWVAGAYTENVKVIHIVGTTSTKAQKARAVIHHCLGPNPDHRLREDIGESGTAQFRFSDAQLASGVQYLTQVYFGSIGYSAPACLGAQIARNEAGKGKRAILVVGDGSLQLTVQEIGTMVKMGLRNVIIIVINNSEYTIERAIHGPNQGYNDIASWDYQPLLSAFAAKDGEINSRRGDTNAVFEDVVFANTHLSKLNPASRSDHGQDGCAVAVASAYWFD
ncbi:thiamine diphosphate-binding protein [Aspergillus aurantiobrunneus]